MNREPTPDGGVGDPLCTAAPDPAPPEPTDVASRLVAANAEAQRLQCECAVGFGAYACVENCEAELFKLEPNGDVECFRELLGTTLDTPTVECQLGAIEALNECVPSAECDDDAFTACLIPFEVALSSCPDAAQGFETLADGCFDRTGEELVGLYSASLDVAHEEACRCVADEERDACLAFKESPREDCLSSLLDIAPLPRRVTECLIEYLDEETEFLEDEACCESPDDFDCRSGTFWFSGPLNQLAGQRFRISGALVNCLGSEQNHIVYTATGTLSDAAGGDAAQLEGATLTVRISADPDASSTPLSSGTSERAVWNAAASYTITGRPDGAPNLSFAAPTELDMVNRFPADPGTPQLPSDPPDTVRIESASGLLEGAPVDLPFVQASYLSFDLFKDRGSPTIRSLPSYHEALSGGALADASGGGAFSYDYEVEYFRGDPIPVFDATEAVLYCMGPEPELPFAARNDAGRCGDEEALLVSGGLEDFMAVSRSAAQDDSGDPYLYYLVIRRDEISQLQAYVEGNPLLAELDPIRALVSALEAADDSEDDYCEDGGGVVSVALPPEAGRPPDLSQVAARIEQAQRALDTLQQLDLQTLKEEAVQIALDTVRAAVCPTIGVAVNAVIAPRNFKRLAVNIAVQGILGAVTGCNDILIE
jgi:hypothetical protein